MAGNVLDEMTLPLWQYGKPRTRSGGYGVLSRAGAFAEGHEGILRRVAARTAWRPGGAGEYPAYWGCWPLGGDDWLLFRFLDDGADDHGRPHTLRIEALLCAGRPWRIAGSLLTPAAWPAPAEDGAGEMTLVPGGAKGAVPEKPPEGPVLYGPAPCVLDAVLFAPPEAAPGRAEGAESAAAVLSSRGLTMPNTSMRGDGRSGGWRYVMVGLAAFVLGGILAWPVALGYERSRRRQATNRAELERVEAQQENFRLTEAVRQLTIAHEKEKQAREAAERVAAGKDREARQLADATEQWRANARKQLPLELRERYDRLDHSLKNSEAAAERLRTALDEFVRDAEDTTP